MVTFKSSKTKESLEESLSEDESLSLSSFFATFLVATTFFFSSSSESLLSESLLELESLELELESEEDASLRDFCVYALRVGSCGRNEVNRM